VVRNFKKIILNLILVAMFALIPVITVFAVPSYGYYTDITVTNTSGTARTNIGVTTATNVSALNSAGYINATGTNTQVENAGSQSYYGLANDKVNIYVPSLAGYQSQTYRLYLNYNPVVGDGTRNVPYNFNFPVVLGDGGYVTTTDNAALEPASDFQITAESFIDFTKPGLIASKPTALYFGAPTYGSLVGVSYVTGANNDVTVQTQVGSIIDNYNGARTSTATLTGATWISQTFTTTSAYSIQGVGLLLISNTLGDLTVGIKSVDAAHKPTGNYLTSGTLTSCIGDNVATYYEVVFQTPYALSNGVEYAIVASTPSGSIAWGGNVAGGYAGGIGWSSTDSGATWAALAGPLDLDFNIYKTNVATPPITSAFHTVIFYTDGGNFKLSVDAVVLSTIAIGAVPDNANNWLFFSNAVPYSHVLGMHIGGNPVLTYRPLAIISGTTLNDETGTYDGTITWGANSNITVTFSGITSYATQVPVVSSSGNVVTLEDVNSPSTWYGTTANLLNLPFYYSFNKAATNMGIPTQNLYLMMILGVASAIGLSIFLFTGSGLIGIIGAGFVIYVGTATGVIGGWILYAYIILGVGSLFLLKKT